MFVKPPVTRSSKAQKAAAACAATSMNYSGISANPSTANALRLRLKPEEGRHAQYPRRRAPPGRRGGAKQEWGRGEEGREKG